MFIRDLSADYWDHVNSVEQETMQSLVALVQRKISRVQRVHFNLTAHGQPLPVDALPLTTRTRNALCQRFGEQSLPPQLTLYELLLIPNIGMRSMMELTCVVEAAQSHKPLQHTKSPLPQNTGPPLPPDASSFFQLLAAWAAGERQLETLGSALPDACSDWPDELQHLWTLVGRSDAHSLAGDMIDRYSVPALLSCWINGLDERLAHILNERVFSTEKPRTLEQLGEHHMVTRERIRQIQKKGAECLEELRSATFQPVLRRAKELGNKLGTVLPESDPYIEDVLRQAVADFDPHHSPSFAQQILLWLAGPYRNRDGWLTTESKIDRKTKTALLSYENNRSLIPADDVRTALNELGIREAHHTRWIDHLGQFQRVDDGLLHLTGTIPDKARQLLRYLDRPITADEVVEWIGSSSVRSVRQRLMEDPRFWRINKQNQFVLAGTSGYDEYTGITDEIMQEIEARGGSATVKHLVKKITKSYGVQPTSVLAYLSTPLFVRNESGLVRVRKDEEVEITTDISKTASCYLIDDRWAWRIRIDHQLMRGSGRMFPNAFARELGCDLGDKIEVSSAFGNITVSWLAGSATGAALGSIRSALKGLNAEIGDDVFLISHGQQIEFKLLRQDQLKTESSIGKLALLVGVLTPTDSDAILPQIAAALNLDHQLDEPLEQQIRDVLLGRGEDELYKLIQPPTLSMDQYLDRIGDVLGGNNISD